MTAGQIEDRLACGLLVTTPARTLLDLGAVVPAEMVESALEDVLMRRLVSFDLLTRTPERLGGSGRKGAGVRCELVEEGNPATAPTQSRVETSCGGLGRRTRCGSGRWPGCALDFAHPNFRVGIEADGGIWHGRTLDVQRNRRQRERPGRVRLEGAALHAGRRAA